MDIPTNTNGPGSTGGDRARKFTGGAGLVAAGALAGAVLAGTVAANAATPSPTPSSSTGSGTSSNGQSAGPGVQENDGIPEAQEHHGHGQDLGLTGTVTAVSSNSVTIKTSAGATTTYTVDSSSDIDKNGEAQLSNLAAGDAVRFSVRTGTTTIDKLHAGDETKDMPAAPTAGASGSSYSGTANITGTDA